MAHYGAVEIEGDPEHPKVVSELKENSVKNKHLDKEDIFIFKNLQLEDEKGNKYKLKIKSNKLEVTKEVKEDGKS